MSDATQKETRALAEVLERKGYAFRDLSGPDAAPLSGRVELARGDEALTCAIHRTTMGRMSFRRRDDGSYDGLDDAPYILHTNSISKTALRVSLFRRAVVLAAVEAGWTALQAEGKGRAAIMVNPSPEKRQRFAGSGFADAAEWVAVMEYARPAAAAPSLSGPDEAPPDAPRAEPGGARSDVMQQVKAMLADHVGVDPDRIEIDVRIRF